MKSKALIISTAILVLILFMSFTVSCRKEEPAAQNGAEDASDTAEESPQEEAEDSASIEDDEAAGPAEEDSQEPEEEPVQEEDEEEAEIPGEITAKVDEADSLFADGMYAEASQAYRNAQIAIEGSELSDETKAGLLAQIGPSQSQAKNIADTARMHHSNAMTLIYEKRYEEAEAELNAALDIYPKYQTAIDALESLEDIKGLQ
jgi:tetratricopeptide (TPR) repeat protein